MASFAHIKIRKCRYDGKDIVPSFLAMHTLGFYLSKNFQLLDLAGPAAAFEIAHRQLDSSAYRMVYVSESGGLVKSSLGTTIDTEAVSAVSINTLVVVGKVLGPPELPSTISEFITAARRCQRVASVCTGAFVLAAAGFLDGKRATTHWHFAGQLQREYPRVRVEADRIFCRDGQLWTSAGITAGIDLALALIEQDHGLPCAQVVARYLVVSHRRLGGQSQFAPTKDAIATNSRIAASIRYARESIKQKFTVEQMAEAANLSLRQFSRAFRYETGTTPARFVERIRADLARGYIEAGTETLGNISQAVGFGDEERMRRAFLRVFGHPPQSLRRSSRLGRPADTE